MNAKTAEFQSKILERTFNFSENLIKVVVKLPNNSVNEVLRKQVIRSGTSIGANYREACEAESTKDFVHKLRISKKESRETEYWLELILRVNPNSTTFFQELINESKEFTKIFSSIIKKFI